MVFHAGLILNVSFYFLSVFTLADLSEIRPILPRLLDGKLVNQEGKLSNLIYLGHVALLFVNRIF